MKWFLALNESSLAFDLYCGLAKVAIHSALVSTSLRPHFVYDGKDNAFTEWLEKHDVPILKHESFLKDELIALSARRDNPTLAAIARGASLRVELPRIAKTYGMTDRLVLYTDCDVFFRGDVVSELQKLDCHCFAVAPEFELTDYRHMNTGVMLMNLPKMEETLPAFEQFIRANLEWLPDDAWDQGAYRKFYLSHDQPLWDRLPPELNWKPYWGDSPLARIIHFHGPKPFHRGYFDSYFQELKPLTGGSFAKLAGDWDRLLQTAA